MGGSDKILVVDDEAVICELLSDILEDEGYPVESRPNAPAALDALKEDEDFVLLFTDITMPEMNGIELIRRARQMRPALVPIVMTGFATLETARAAVREGAYDYVLKPFSLSEVKMAVSNALERYKLANENVHLHSMNELFNISEHIASIHDEHQLLEYVLEAAMSGVGAARGSIMLTSEDGKALSIAASKGLPEEARHERIAMGTGISGMVAEKGAALMMSDVADDPEIQRRSRQLNNRSFISVPLEHKPDISGNGDAQRVLAVLNVTQKHEDDSFSEGDLKRVSIIANHASSAIENARLIRDIDDAHLETIHAMARLVEAKDPTTLDHSRRVCNTSLNIARALGVSEGELETLTVASHFHDIGKIGVPDTILLKNEKLSDSEWQAIRQHPIIGYDILKQVKRLSPKHLDIVRSHHERLDGSGYPDKLKGDAISSLVRIVSVADAYDAMAHDMPFRKALSPSVVVEQLGEGSGTQFDPDVVDAAVRLAEAGTLDGDSE
jgi:response regulator RpfG family c-di-GMP phosphodiesterase